MKFAVRYYTKTGNTKRLAEAIAKELGVEALPISEPINEETEILFLGNSYYAFNIDPEVKKWYVTHNIHGNIHQEPFGEL
jgi:flavodoxin